MAIGNKGFAGLVTGGGEGALEPRRPPRTGILATRENRLSDLAAGTVVTRVHEAVDPATCRIWDGHNRDYAALDDTRCADLIESFKAQGRQEVPAIVRRIRGDAHHKFEVVCGARRHWSVTWLRAHDYPDFKFIVEPREMTDEEAFRVADLENRSRKDLSDYERASDYARAIERYYEGSQQRMVERLQVTKSWLSRYLELAKLPPEIIACFHSPHAIGISHAAKLAPLLGHPKNKAGLLERSGGISSEQARRLAQGESTLTPAEVVARLTKDPQQKGASPTPKPIQDILDGDEQLLVTVQDKGRAGVVFVVPHGRIQDRQAVAKAIERQLGQLAKHR